jgi:hypothetical protein
VKGVEPEENPHNSRKIPQVSAAGGVEASLPRSVPMPVDADLQSVVEAWPALAEPIRAAILALVGTARGGGRDRGS